MNLTTDTDVAITLSKLQNEMADKLSKHNELLEIVLFGDNKAEHEVKWKTYQEKQSRLEKHRFQTFLMILGQCSQHILAQMKQGVMWTTVAKS